MSRFIGTSRLAAAVVALLLTGSGGAFAQQDAFAQACLGRGKASPQKCQCQAKLARATFTAPERAAMIRGMKGETAGFNAALKAMGETRKQAFLAKIQTLGARTERECR
ncbi:MAG: hypothetical protein K2X62_07650 [Beijerinckiaceae bacterium]|jgi:hypothetical protein|nr:hypothetical protein [Beijerinckiaceae bacterium]